MAKTFDELRREMTEKYGGKTTSKSSSKDTDSRLPAVSEDTKRETASSFSSLRSEMNEKYNRYANVSESFVNKFISDANTFMKADDSSAYKTWNSLDLGSRIDTFRGWLWSNRDKLDEETYKSLHNTVGTLTSLRDYYAGFETEDDYTRSSIGWLDIGGEKTAESVAKRQEYYQSNQDRIDAINEELPWYANTWLPNGIEDIFLSKEKESLRDEAEALKADNLKYERTQGVTDKYYTPVTEEFTQNAAYRDYSNASMEEIAEHDAVVKTIKAKNLGYDYDGNMVDATGRIVYAADHPVVKAMRENDLGGYYDTIVEDKLGMYLSASEEDLELAYERLLADNQYDTWAILLNEGETHAWKELTEGEIDIYYNLYKTQGQTAAYQYLKDMETELTRRATQKRADEISEAGLLEQLALNAASIPMNVIGGVVGLIGDAADAIKGESYNPYSAAHSWSNDASAIRQDTAADINKATGNAALPWVGTTFGDVYQSIMSFGDSVMASYIPGGAALLGTNAATAEMKELYERGASTEQLLAGGILAGAAEMFFESVSIGELEKIKNMDLKDAKNAVDILVRGVVMGGVEASEEMATEIANTITDAIVMGSQTDWVDMETFAKNVVNAGIGGFISGGFGGALGTAVNHVQYNSMAAEHGQSIIDNGGQESIDALKQLALEMYSDKGGVDALRGIKSVNKVADKATSKNVGRLSDQIESTISKQNRTDVQTALVKQGLSKNEAALVSAYITNSNELTPQQVTEVETNARFQSAMDEVLTDPELNISDNGMKLTLARNGVYEKKTPVKQTEQSEASAQQPQAIAATENAPVEQPAAESEFSGSETGKTTYNGTEVKVAGVASVENGEVMVRLDNGEVVNARDVEFGREDDALLYEAVADMGMDVDAANDYIQGFNSMKGFPLATPQSVSSYMLGFREAHTYGRLGIPSEALARDGKYSVELSDGQRQIAYNRGSIERINEAKAAQSAVSEKTVKANKTYKDETHVSKIKSSKAYKNLSDTQKASLDGLTAIYKALGIDVYLFESPTDAKGRRLGKNGYYNPEDKSVHIDLYAGNDGRGTMIFTTGHELTHFIKDLSPEKFEKFADILFERLEKEGHSVAALIAKKKEFLKKHGRITPEMSETEANDLAREEAVADACETMLADGEAFAEIAERIHAKDKGLWNAIKRFFNDLVAKIKNAYADLDPDSIVGQQVAEMLDTAEELRSLWVDMLVEASEVKNGLVEVDMNTESVAPVMNSERTWTASEYVTNRDQMAEKIANALGVSLQKAKGYIDDINSIAKMIADDRVRLDYEASSFGSAFVSNVEYGGSFDYTTLCKKRRIYTGTFTEIQKRLHDVALSPDDILKIRNLMIEEGIEATCGLCYVEGSRANMGKFAKEFIRLYKRDNPLAWISNMADVNTPDGVEQMRISHPEAYEQYVYFWNHYGKLKDSDPALFASQQKPKLYEARKEYKGEILEHFKGDSTVAKKNRNGGIRMQSFSDFEIVHLIDTMQVIMDMSTVGLAGQAYTKVPEFARAFGETGLKINLSLIAKGVDADGNLIFDDREGMPHETAFDLRDKHSKNVGTIIVTFTDEQLLAAMADPRIDFIIPFHRSQWKKGQYGAMGLPKGTKDYTFMQNEKLIKQTYHEYRGKMVKDKASNYMPNEYWDFSKSGKENAEAYLKMCAENNKRPKFYKLLDYDGKGTYSLKADGSTDGYWKLLIDFKMYDNDGVGSPQMAVTPTFSMDEAMAMLDEYQGGHSKYPVASGVVDAFVDEYNESNGTMYSDRDSDHYSYENYSASDYYTNGTIYSYDFLTAQKEMVAVELPKTGSLANRRGQIDDSKVLAEGTKNALSEGVEREGKLYVKNVYTGRELRVDNSTIKHGLDGTYNRHLTNARIGSVIGSVVKNAIPINGLQNTSEKAIGTYAMVSYCYDDQGRQFIAIVTVEQHTGNVDSLELYDVAHAVSGRQKKGSQVDTKSPGVYPIEATTISIAQLLEIVNSTHQSILSDDVLNRLGETRNPKGSYSDKVLFSDRDPDSISNRSLLANALESVAQNDIERNKLQEYKSKIALIESEQAKLAETRAKIKELSFAKGRRDTEAIKKLQFEANQSANRINTYDRQLLNLESTAALKGVLEREKQLAYKKAERKGKEALARQRERDAETQRELLTRYQESRKKGVEGRRKTEMRHKIKNVVNELNQYLLKGTKDKHVPIGLQASVAEALNVVNMDTVGAEERLAEIHAKLQKDPFNHELLERYRRISEQGERMDAKLQAFKNAYDEILNSDDPLVANSHDEVISNSIANVMKVVGDTPIRDMSLTQLEMVYDLYKMVLTTIRNTNKAFKAAKGEEISTIANGVIAELDAKKKNPMTVKGLDTLSEFDWNNLKPVYAFERIGSANFTKVFNAVRAGEDVWARDMSEAQAFREAQYKKHNYKTFDFDKKYDFVSSTGLKFTLRLDQIMSLYAYSKRGQQAKDHLKYGGFQFDGVTEVKEKKGKVINVTYQLKDTTAYKLSDELLAEIIGVLDEVDGAKAFVDEMQEYLSSTMGEKGNEVSLALYDVKLFKEKNYFPLKVSHDFLARAREQAQGDVKIKNSGFTKETTPNAKNPIVLSSFMDVWANHVNEMSMYHAFTLPLEDFYRVYNYSTPSDEKLDTISVVSSLRGAHRDAAVSYIDQLLKDLNGGARSDPRETFGKAMMSKFKKASVMASLSVVIQQPSAIVRATALIDAKYFAGNKVAKGKHKEMWEEIKKYAPVAIIKEMGYFDTGMGKSSVEWLKGDKTWMDKVDDAVSKAPSLADELTWVAIWNAVKRETLHTYKHLQPNSDAFLQAAGERFTEVITKTQVYDSTLARSANMRSKGGFMNMWTAFMAEPTTSINMLQDAFQKGNKKRIARTLGAVYGSVLLNSALVSIIYAMRDDDEDETFLEKYLSRFVTEVVDGLNPLTYIPFFKDIWSAAQGFDIERADMSLITEAIDSLQQLVKVASKDTSDFDEDELAEHKKSIAEALMSIADTISSLVGVPVKNVRRDLKGIINFFRTVTNGNKTTAGSLADIIGGDLKDSVPVWGWFPDEGKEDKLYDAIIKGDTAYVDRLKSGYKSDNAYHSAIRAALRENDPRIHEAAVAKDSGKIAEYTRIAKAIIAEGRFKQDDVVAAINAEINSLNKSEPAAAKDKAKGLYEMDDYFAALIGRDQASAYAVKEDIIKTAVANGKNREDAEDSFLSSFASGLKERYEDGEVSYNEAINMLVNYGEKTEESAEARVQYWEFKEQYPNYDLSEDAVTKYYAEVEPSGIGIRVYYDYSKQRAKCKGVDENGDGRADSGSVKSEVLNVIDSLPITSEQKDVLYYLNGWSASTIFDAPWH